MKTTEESEDFHNLCEAAKNNEETLPLIGPCPDVTGKNNSCWRQHRARSNSYKFQEDFPPQHEAVKGFERRQRSSSERHTSRTPLPSLDCSPSASSYNERNPHRPLKKSTSFDYFELRDDEYYPSRFKLRRTAICSKLRNPEAVQLESFIITTRLKHFNLI